MLAVIWLPFQPQCDVAYDRFFVMLKQLDHFHWESFAIKMIMNHSNKNIVRYKFLFQHLRTCSLYYAATKQFRFTSWHNCITVVPNIHSTFVEVQCKISDEPDEHKWKENIFFARFFSAFIRLKRSLAIQIEVWLASALSQSGWRLTIRLRQIFVKLQNRIICTFCDWAVLDLPVGFVAI